MGIQQTSSTARGNYLPDVAHHATEDSLCDPHLPFGGAAKARRQSVDRTSLGLLFRLSFIPPDTAGESIEANSSQSPFVRMMMGSGMDSEG